MSEVNETAPEQSITVITGEAKIRALAYRVKLRAYKTWATTGIVMSRNMHPSVRAFNGEFGTSCKRKADIPAAVDLLIKALNEAEGR